MEARRLHVISGSWFGSLMPFSLHAPRHIGMEEVGWWGDPRRWDYRHASMRRQAWRRLGGGETRVRGLYSRSRTLDFCLKVTSAADSGNIGSDGTATSVGSALTSASVSLEMDSSNSTLWSPSFRSETSSSQSQGLWLVGPAIDVGFLGDLKSDWL